MHLCPLKGAVDDEDANFGDEAPASTLSFTSGDSLGSHSPSSNVGADPASCVSVETDVTSLHSSGSFKMIGTGSDFLAHANLHGYGPGAKLGGRGWNCGD
ncbi:hypothetical protein CVT25_001146 [Psilocybe cyanescens]|uniref:Uncharacterized protein n=1 Tax=Psilocybe cyanescens TaxID=93625 RepID=A0A409XB55_PSICY|nr:hypothetical protein CVT25_001146 [Psilocybe cyanescens]